MENEKVFITQKHVFYRMDDEMSGVFPGDEDVATGYPGDEIMSDERAKPPMKIDKRIVIAVIAIIVVVAVLAVFSDPIISSINKIGMIDVPGIGGSDQTQMLIIGEPSVELLTELDNQRDLVYYRVKDAADLDVNPAEQLAEYDVILLDQHLGATPYDKSVSRALGEAIENYVMTGGKLVVIMDSGIYRSSGEFGTGVASDVIGWEETFGNLIPVECDELAQGVLTCTQPIIISGTIERLEQDSEIMQGIETAPADPRYGSLNILTFDVKPLGEQVAYINSAEGTKNYPGIVEKNLIIGKMIYFNYDPAITPGIWQNTLEYLR